MVNDEIVFHFLSFDSLNTVNLERLAEFIK